MTHRNHHFLKRLGHKNPMIPPSRPCRHLLHLLRRDINDGNVDDDGYDNNDDDDDDGDEDEDLDEDDVSDYDLEYP